MRPAEKRQHQVAVRLSAEELGILTEAAALRGTSREACLRAGIVLLSGRLPHVRGLPTPPPAPDEAEPVPG